MQNIFVYRKKGLCIFLAILLLLSVLQVHASEFSPEDVSTPMRGIYIATVYHLDFPSAPTTDSKILQSEIDDIVSTCSSLGFNSIFLQVCPCADAIYPSSIFPWSRYLTGTQGTPPSDQFDPLLYWISTAHAYGMELHAWINPYRITRKSSDWNTLSATHPAKLYPECVIQYHDGNYYFDPANPAVRNLIISNVLEIITHYEVDGIHMDDYFYPGADFPDDASFVKYNNDNFLDKAEWRRNNINMLIQELDEQIHSYNPALSFGISCSGVWENASINPLGSQTRGGNPCYSKQFADTRKWALEGWVDYLAPQIYWENGNTFCDYATLLDWWSLTLADCDTRLYISLADYRAGEVSETNTWYNGHELSIQLKQNAANPIVTGELHYRYHSVATNLALQSVITNCYH